MLPVDEKNIRGTDRCKMRRLCGVNRDALKTVHCIRKQVINVFSHIVVCLLTFILFTDVLSVNFVPSESMEPTIRHNHLIINWRLSYLLVDPMPEYGAVIVFRENADSKCLLVKRVIGLPGDTISFSDGRVYRNGEEIREPYLLKQKVSYSAVTEFSVPDGALFVMGDNRENSNDSRFMAGTYIPVENVYARELFQL